MPGKKILMLVGDFTEEYEIFVYQQGMEAVGHTVHVVCPNKKAGDMIKTSLHDFEGDQTYTEKLGHFFQLNKTFKDVKETEYDAVYVAGGRGPEYIRIYPRVIEILRNFHAAGKPIFSICHGIQVLAAAEIIDGRRVAALEYCEPEVRLARGIYSRRAANRRAARRQHGDRQGLARPRRLHARVPGGAGHRDPSRQGDDGRAAQAEGQDRRRPHRGRQTHHALKRTSSRTGAGHRFSAAAGAFLLT